jgi:glutamine synthetase
VEITLEHGDAWQAMDQAVRYKRLVKGVAHKHGMQACSWPSRSTTWPAPACTCTSAWPTPRAQPVRQRGPGRHPAAAPGVGGMLATLLDSLLLFCPNANSYRRFQANSYAPLAPTWGVDNRTVSLRVPGGPANSRHIEHRICGADANPYLAAAAILAGIHRGIRETRSEPVQGNGYAQAKSCCPPTG